MADLRVLINFARYGFERGLPLLGEICITSATYRAISVESIMSVGSGSRGMALSEDLVVLVYCNERAVMLLIQDANDVPLRSLSFCGRRKIDESTFPSLLSYLNATL